MYAASTSLSTIPNLLLPFILFVVVIVVVVVGLEERFLEGQKGANI